MYVNVPEDLEDLKTRIRQEKIPPEIFDNDQKAFAIEPTYADSSSKPSHIFK